jgi:SpoVK/Ycf46/Vps4 family AAA+-type ATPase
MQDLDDLNAVVAHGLPIIVIESYEEARALELLTRLAIKRIMSMYHWTLSDGLKRSQFGEEPNSEGTKKPLEVLRHIKQTTTEGLYVLCDMHPFLEEPSVVRLLKDIAISGDMSNKTVVLLSYKVDIPPEVSRLSARFSFKLPGENQLMKLIQDEARAWGKETRQRVKTDAATLKQLIQHLKGVTISDARRLIRGAIADDNAITESDLPQINKAKFELMDMESVLAYEYQTAQFNEVAGLKHLKKWLDIRKNAFIQEDSNLRPKGLLLLGVQGSGKSLAAKAIAGTWQLPLLRLDMGAMYNKFFGETERNLRDALALADMMSPCVLWLDEIEKGLGTDSNDNGVSQRILGTLLTWMSERTTPVFMVATANDIQKMPPELVRKGRFDEVFFVDLPKENVRKEIFEIHLNKRGIDPSSLNLSACVVFSEGFSGAEIEQAVVSAIHVAQAQNSVVNADFIVEELNRTQPLSVLMGEKLDDLRAWAHDRTVLAD